MNRHIAVNQAKAHFAELLGDVAHGEAIHITKHGKPIATLLPYQPAATEVTQAVEALRHLAKKTSLKGVNVKALITAGRR